ncbi:hypothetical protein IMX26_00595 [Clostridium sp. 'deep sea']|uniref:hypothetical protein n=1 Tax=Clostridium sp. 'deep sea' TaxID=2779445 RepID=UPI0018969688|nr:hypothetical protein [Clostridium sp. 'deep sea']QOR35374.1 hypothetical protein IMX26_00595 [Clostridium sp. 'deep sea']
MKIRNFTFNKSTVTANVANKQTAVNNKLLQNFSLNQNQTNQLLALFSTLQITSYEQLIGYLNNPQVKQYFNKTQNPKLAQNMPNPNAVKEVPEISKDLYKLMQQFAQSATRDHLIYDMVRKNMLKTKVKKDLTKNTTFVFTENLTHHKVNEKPKAELAINEYASVLINKQLQPIAKEKPTTLKEKDNRLLKAVAWTCAFMIPLIFMLVWLLK